MFKIGDKVSFTFEGRKVTGFVSKNSKDGFGGNQPDYLVIKMGNVLEFRLDSQKNVSHA